jgi:hypothetical protein
MSTRSLPKAATESPNKSPSRTPSVGTGFVKAVSKTGLWASAVTRAQMITMITPRANFITASFDSLVREVRTPFLAGSPYGCRAR